MSYLDDEQNLIQLYRDGRYELPNESVCLSRSMVWRFHSGNRNTDIAN